MTPFRHSRERGNPGSSFGVGPSQPIDMIAQ